MSAVFRKLNLKGRSEIVVVHSPDSFEPEIDALEGVKVVRDPGRAKKEEEGFACASATRSCLSAT